jgi:hypothetical protein
VAREAAARCAALGADRKRKPDDKQRNGSETPHEDIVRRFLVKGGMRRRSFSKPAPSAPPQVVIEMVV